MKKKATLFFLLYILITLLAVPVKSEANAGMGFSYTIVRPENQISTAGYFDLRMTPGQNQKVAVELTNSEDKEVTVGVSLNSAKTNSNGVIEYGPSALENDKSLKHDFVNLVKAPSEIVLPAKGTATLELDVTMPEESFDGYVSGGIQLKQVVEKKKDEEKTGVTNEYAFLIGMLLSETETAVEPNLELNKVYAEMFNYRNAVFANFSNIEPEYLEDMTVDMQVFKKGDEEVLYDTKKAGMRMAPNSMIDFPLEMNGDRMVAGDYTAHILVASGEKNWEWSQDFTITDEDADKFNNESIGLTQERGIDWKLIALIVGGVFVIVLVIFLIIRLVRKKGKKPTGKKKRKKK